jgi:signal transduction histidine kinase
MRLRRLFRTTAFQLALLYMALFALSVGAISAFVYWSTLGYFERQTNAIIEAEINGLYEQYERQGLRGLADIINERVQRGTERRMLYLFADAIGRPIAGNLPPPPSLSSAEGPWVDFTLREESTGVETPVRAALLRVGPGFWLLVGRDIRELAEIKRSLKRASAYGVSLTLVLALIGGALLALSAQRRLGAINRTTRQIIAGDLSRRAELKGSNDEYDELATNVNAMLDQIENLLAGMRHVGDSVAHDLRGPLTRLRNRLETLSNTPQPQPEDLVECVEQLDHVLDTFNALLRIARVESGAYRSHFTAVDLAPIVHDVCELYHAAAEERQVTLRSAHAAPVEVFGDRELLAQALTNLLDNAVKYTPPGGLVSVELGRAGDTAKLSVRDSGPGVPETERNRVLQRFVRLDRARSQPGNGLGLALVNAVTLQHHGRLTLGDNAPGLIVTLELPALTPARSTPPS